MSWVSTNKLTQLANSLRNKFTTNELVLANSDKSKGAYLNVGGQDGLITMSPMVEDGSTPAALWVTDSAANNATELTGGTLSYVTDVGADTEDYTSLSLVGGVVNVSGKNGAQRRITNVADPVKSSDVANKWSTFLKSADYKSGGIVMLSGSDAVSLNELYYNDPTTVLIKIPPAITTRDYEDETYNYAYTLPAMALKTTPTSSKIKFRYYLKNFPVEDLVDILDVAFQTERHQFIAYLDGVVYATGYALVSASFYYSPDGNKYPAIEIELYLDQTYWSTVVGKTLFWVSPAQVILRTYLTPLFPEV